MDSDGISTDDSAHHSWYTSLVQNTWWSVVPSDSVKDLSVAQSSVLLRLSLSECGHRHPSNKSVLSGPTPLWFHNRSVLSCYTQIRGYMWLSPLSLSAQSTVTCLHVLWFHAHKTQTSAELPGKMSLSSSGLQWILGDDILNCIQFPCAAPLQDYISQDPLWPYHQSSLPHRLTTAALREDSRQKITHSPLCPEAQLRRD